MFYKSLILIVALFFSNVLYSQDGSNVEVSFSTIKTELRNEALNAGIKYLNSLNEIWKKRDPLFDGKGYLVSLSPEFDIETGGSDAFSSITAKLTALTMTFEEIDIDGIKTPNTSKLFHTFPASLGFETTDDFDILNGLIEIGWMPWYQSNSLNLDKWNWVKNTKVGFFVQGGNKFKLSSPDVPEIGGKIDESAEAVKDAIFRIKGNAAFNIKKLFNIELFGLIGDGSLWYDILNEEFYYRLEGKLRINITDDKHFDLEYQKGSGAPNFNEGDQFGIGLGIAF